MNKSFIVLLVVQNTGDLNFLGSGLTIRGNQAHAYHFVTRDEAEQAGQYFCQENRAIYYDFGVRKESDFVPHVIAV